MSMTRQRPGAPVARLGVATPTGGTVGGYPWSDGEYLYAADLNAAFGSLFTAGPFLPIAGGTLTGPLLLAANPAQGMGAATKSYVDTSVAGISGAFALSSNTGRNLLHNPLFNVAQRGGGPFTFGYTMDRWVIIASSDTVSVTQTLLSDAQRATIGDEEATWCLYNTFTGNAAAGAFNLVCERIENVRRLAGKTVTVSFWAAEAAGKVGVSIDQNFGTGGSPSTTVTGNGVAVTLSTTLTRYSVTATLPTISGKTLGTNGDHYTQLNLWFSSGATQAVRAGNIGVQSGTIPIWGVQLEVGSAATPLEKPDPRYDLSNCQRFYETSSFGNSGSAGSGGNSVNYIQQFAVQKRAVPTITTSAVTTVNVNTLNYGASTSGFSPSATTIVAGGYIFSGGYTASADL